MRTRTRLVAAAASTMLLAGSVAGLTTTSASAASAPGKPAKVSATSGKGAYTLSWKKPKGKVDRFEIADRTKAKGKWQPWETKTVKGKKKAAKVKGKNGSLHQARVRAHNAQGWGAWSKKVKVRIGLPATVKGVAVTGGDKQATVTWRAASGNGSKLKSYAVQTRVAGGAWAKASVGGTATSLVLKNVGEGKEVQARVRAVNKVGAGAWSAIADGTTHPKPNPKITVGTPGPYVEGDEVQVSFTGFPYSEGLINVAVCANDGRPLSGPGDCAPLGGASNQLVSSVKGAGTTTITIPSGGLGNENAPAIDCTDGTVKCAIVAATITSNFHFAGPIPIEYVDPVLIVSNEGPFDGGETVTATFAGFPGDHPQINVAVCRMDQMPMGPQDCAPLMGPSNQIVNAVNGAGSVDLVIPTSLVLGDTTLDCTAGPNCGILATTITSDFHMADPIILTYTVV
jgi:hypothetical protein